jgi:hypothetical protein
MMEPTVPLELGVLLACLRRRLEELHYLEENKHAGGLFHEHAFYVVREVVRHVLIYLARSLAIAGLRADPLLHEVADDSVVVVNLVSRVGLAMVVLALPHVAPLGQLRLVVDRTSGELGFQRLTIRSAPLSCTARWGMYEIMTGIMLLNCACLAWSPTPSGTSLNRPARRHQ